MKPPGRGLSVPIKNIIYVMVAVLVIADGDYPDYPALSEELYFAIFSQVIPGFFSPFECLSYFLAFFSFMAAKGPGFRREAFKAQEFKLLLFVATLLLTAVLGAAVHGIATSGQGRIAFWQLRSFPAVLSWAVTGYFALESPADAIRFLNVLTASVFVKSFHNLFIFAFGHGLHLEPEYLSSHIASLYMGTSVLRLAIAIAYELKGSKRLAAILAMIFIAYIWKTNDRRISYIGMIFSGVFSMLFLYRYLNRWHIAGVLGLVLGAGLSLVVLAASGSNNDFVQLFVGSPVKSPFPDYRDIENFNLYSAVAENPFTGRGFGFPFKQYMPLPDIFSFGETLLWIPHNNILLIWANSGPFGLAAFGALISFAIAAMVRLFRTSDERELRIFAIIGFAVFVQWTLYFWADMALSWTPSMLVPGVLCGFAFKLLHLKRIHSLRNLT